MMIIWCALFVSTQIHWLVALILLSYLFLTLPCSLVFFIKLVKLQTYYFEDRYKEVEKKLNNLEELGLSLFLFENVACCNPRLKQAIMSLKSYQSQAEQLLKYLVLSDPVVPYISIPAGILASKLVPSRHLWLFFILFSVGTLHAS